MKQVWSNSRNVYHLYRKRRSFAAMITDTIKGRYKLSPAMLFTLIAGLAYIIFPADVLPDFIPLVGWLDDGVVLYFILKRLRKELIRYAVYKNA